MIWTGLLVVCLVASTQADEDAPFVIASMDNIDRPKFTNLLPQFDDDAPFNFQQAPFTASRGRSDIEIEKDQPFTGYVYPKPSRPFNFPAFRTLDAVSPSDASAAFSSDDSSEVLRSQRSPQRRQSSGRRNRPRRPNFNGGFGGGYPWNGGGIRPLPALYNRPFY